MSLTYYDINFRNKELDEVRVRITDYSLYDPFDVNPDTYIDLVGVAPAFELETFNTSEDKFSPILGQRATIRFKSTNAVNFSTFAQGEDYRFFVRATYSNNTKFIFTGWLIMEENQQAYLPPGQPVTLYATDGLAALKDVELSDFDDARPEGKYRLIEIIAWCLRKTEGFFPGQGSSIYDNIKVAVNLFENNHDNTNNCPLNQTYVDIRTFEKNATEYEDCYTVLEKILFSLGARVCQYNNSWWIIRIDELKQSALILHTYSIGGAYQSEAETYVDRYLDSDGSGAFGYIDFVEGSTIQRLQRPSKKASIAATYGFPSEIPENNGFLRGTLSLSVAGPPAYDLFIPSKWVYDIIPSGAHSNQYFIKVTYDTYNNEVERFLFLTATTGNVDMRVRSTSPIYVCQGDKFKLSLDVRYSNDLGGGSGHFSISQAQIRLYGDDSTYWTMYAHVGNNVSSPGVYWIQSDVTWSTNNKYFTLEGESQDIDFTEWQSLSVESAAIPTTGYIEIHLVNNFTSGSQGKDYYNLKFEYIPLVNGTNRSGLISRPVRPIRVPRSPGDKGEQFSLSTTGNYTKKTEHEYFLFDGPCKMFKGAMFYLNTGVYYLTSEWFDASILNYNPSEMLTVGERFLRWQVYSLWNQSRLSTLILNASLFGLDSANDAITQHAGLIHQYLVLNALTPTNNKYFLLLSMRQDWHTCQWTGTFAEINWNADRREDGDFEFKYLE